jgi:hypothetical protein
LHDGKFVHTFVELPSLTDEVWHKMESVFTDKVSQKAYQLLSDTAPGASSGIRQEGAFVYTFKAPSIHLYLVV